MSDIKQSSASNSAPPAISSSTAAINGKLPPEVNLSPGSVIKTDVVADPSAPPEGSARLGVMIDGRFVPLELPEDLAVGDQVQIKVVRQDGLLRLIVLADNEPAPEATKTKDLTREAVIRLLQNEVLDSRQLAVLKETLLRNDQVKLLHGLTTVLANNSELTKIISDLHLASENEIRDPAILEKYFVNFKPAEVKETFSNAKKAIENQMAKFSTPANYDKSQELVALLRQVLFETIDIGGKTSEPIESHTSIQKHLLKSAVLPQTTPLETQVIDRALQSQAQVETDSKVQKLLKLLVSIGSKGSDFLVEGEKLLKALYRSQVDSLKNLEQAVKRLLVSPPEQESLRTLMIALKKIDVNIAATDSPLQVEFKKFIAAFAFDLEKLLLASAKEEALKTFLFDRLEVIYSQFKLPRLADRIGNDGSDWKLPSELTKEQVNLLRYIESQIKTVLDLPEGALFSSTKSALVDENGIEKEIATPTPRLLNLITNLKEIRQKIEMTLPVQSRVFDEFTSRLIERLEETLHQNQSPLRLEHTVRKIMQESLQTLANINQPKPLDQTHEITLPKYEAEVLRQIQVLITNALELLSVNDSPGDNLDLRLAIENIVKHPTFKELKTVLKEIEAIIPSLSNPVEQEVHEIATRLLAQIERDEMRSPQQLVESLRRALDLVQSKIIGADMKEDEKPYMTLERKGVAMLENMVAGQEMLQRLNPVMKAFGEPVMAVFPFIMHGLLAKFEVTSYPKQRLNGEQNKEDGRHGSREAFERVSIVLPLSHFGDVKVDLAHRKGEVVLSFGFESKEVADFVEKKLPSLKAVFRNSGFEEVDCTVSSGFKDSTSSQATANRQHDGLVIA